MSFLPLAGIALQAGASIGGAAASPAPAEAYRGPDYNPVTNINAVGSIDLGKIGELISSVGKAQAEGAETFFTSPAVAGNNFASLFRPSSLALIAIAGVAIIFIWKRYGK